MDDGGVTVRVSVLTRVHYVPTYRTLAKESARSRSRDYIALS